MKTNCRIRLSVNFHFCHALCNYSCAPSFSFSQTVFACSLHACNVYEKKGWGGKREEALYILQSRCPRLKTFHLQCKGNVNLSLLNLTHTRPHRGEKKNSSPLFPLYTHNALKWKTAHTGPGIEGGPNICFALPCSVLISNDQIHNNLCLRVRCCVQNL